MKKVKYICFSILICIIMIFSTACKNETKISEIEDVKEIYHQNDQISLEDALTKAYDLDEMRTFFKESNINEIYGAKSFALSYDDVNRKYPIEVHRTGGYSVYKIKQGGYYYVFWAENLPIDGNVKRNELFVYFTVYLTGTNQIDFFGEIIPNVNNAQDVKKIDSTAEIAFLKTDEFFSYSFLNNEHLIEIEYTTKAGWNELADLIVKRVKLVPREGAPSKYSSILDKDLPL